MQYNNHLCVDDCCHKNCCELAQQGMCEKSWTDAALMEHCGYVDSASAKGQGALTHDARRQGHSCGSQDQLTAEPHQLHKNGSVYQCASCDAPRGITLCAQGLQLQMPRLDETRNAACKHCFASAVAVLAHR